MALLNPFQGVLQVPRPDKLEVAADTGRGQIVQLLNILARVGREAANSRAGSSSAGGYLENGSLGVIDLKAFDQPGFVEGRSQDVRTAIDTHVRSSCDATLQAIGIVYPIAAESPEILIRVENDLGESLDAALPLTSAGLDSTDWRFSYGQERSTQRLLPAVISRSRPQSPAKQLNSVLTVLDIFANIRLSVARHINPVFLVLDYEDKLLKVHARGKDEYDLAVRTLASQCAAGRYQVCGGCNVLEMEGRTGLVTTVEHYTGAAIRLGMFYEFVEGALKAGERLRLDPVPTFFQLGPPDGLASSRT